MWNVSFYFFDFFYQFCCVNGSHFMPRVLEVANHSNPIQERLNLNERRFIVTAGRCSGGQASLCVDKGFSFLFFRNYFPKVLTNVSTPLKTTTKAVPRSPVHKFDEKWSSMAQNMGPVMFGKVRSHVAWGKTVKNALRKIEVGVKPADGSCKLVSKFVICPSSKFLGKTMSVGGKATGETASGNPTLNFKTEALRRF